VFVGLKHKEPLQRKTMQQKISLPNEVTIQLHFLWIKLIKLTPSGTQLMPDMTQVPFATLDAHLLTQTATSSNSVFCGQEEASIIPCCICDMHQLCYKCVA